MAHGIIIEMPEPVHRLSYRVIYGDTDKAGVVYYGTYMRLFEAGRTECMRELGGISYASLEEEGVILPVTEAYCRYKSPARYDDLLCIETAVAKVTKVSIKFVYRIVHEDSGRLVAQGFTVHAAVSPDGRLARMPQAVRGLYEQWQDKGW